MVTATAGEEGASYMYITCSGKPRLCWPLTDVVVGYVYESLCAVELRVSVKECNNISISKTVVDW